MNELKKIEHAPPVLAAETVSDYMPQLIELAKNKEFNTEAFNTLVTFAREEVSRQQRAQFDKALDRFQQLVADNPVVPDMKSRHKRNVLSDRGMWVQVDTMYPSLERLKETIDPLLAQCGLRAQWCNKIVDWQAGNVTVDCVIAGFGNQTEPGRGSYPIVCAKNRDGNDTQTEQEKMMTAETYARKAAYVDVTCCRILKGLDGDMGGPQQAGEKITDQQSLTLNDLIIEAYGSYEKCGHFLKMMEITKLAELPAASFDAACKFLTAKINGAKKA